VAVLQVEEQLAQAVTAEMLVMAAAEAVVAELSLDKLLVWVVVAVTLIALLPNGEAWNTTKSNLTLALKY
jgi:hypothetical protein